MVEINNKTRSRINLRLTKKVVKDFLKYYKIQDREVSVAFVGDKTIRRLNKEYRGVDRITDVLAYRDDEAGYLGEIVIDYAQIKRQAGGYSKSVNEELVFILVHGLLHLLRHDDSTVEGKAEMEKLGQEFIKNTKTQKHKNTKINMINNFVLVFLCFCAFVFSCVI